MQTALLHRMLFTQRIGEPYGLILNKSVNRSKHAGNIALQGVMLKVFIHSAEELETQLSHNLLLKSMTKICFFIDIKCMNSGVAQTVPELKGKLITGFKLLRNCICNLVNVESKGCGRGKKILVLFILLTRFGQIL